MSKLVFLIIMGFLYTSNLFAQEERCIPARGTIGKWGAGRVCENVNQMGLDRSDCENVKDMAGKPGICMWAIPGDIRMRGITAEKAVSECFPVGGSLGSYFAGRVCADVNAMGLGQESCKKIKNSSGSQSLCQWGVPPENHNPLEFQKADVSNSCDEGLKGCNIIADQSKVDCPWGIYYIKSIKQEYLNQGSGSKTSPSSSKNTSK